MSFSWTRREIAAHVTPLAPIFTTARQTTCPLNNLEGQGLRTNITDGEELHRMSLPDHGFRRPTMHALAIRSEGSVSMPT